LRSSIKGRKGINPYFQQNKGIWPGGRILREAVYFPQSQEGKRQEEGEREQVFTREWEDLGVQEEEEPEWVVTIYRPSSSSSSSSSSSAQGSASRNKGNSSGRAYIALTLNHAITDGMGGLRLNNLLLDPNPTALHSLKEENLPLIPALNDHIPTSPSILTILKMLFLIFLAPKLPTFLRRVVQPYDPWLGGVGGTGKVVRRATDCKGGVMVSLLPTSVVDGAKSVGRGGGVPTFHSLLYVGYLAAIWSVYVYRPNKKEEENKMENGKEVEKDKDSTTLFTAQMPTSERDSHPSFTYCTANYVGALIIDIQISTSTPFLAACKGMYDTYHSSSGISQSRQNMGFMQYLPNKPNDPLSPSYNPTRPTTWEDTFLDIFEGEKPYRYSTSLSNLGRAELPDGAEGVCWSLNSHAWQPPFTVDVVGHEEGCEVVTTWMEDAGVGRGEVEEVGREFKRIMGRLAGWQGEELTFGGLVAAT